MLKKMRKLIDAFVLPCIFLFLQGCLATSESESARSETLALQLSEKNSAYDQQLNRYEKLEEEFVRLSEESDRQRSMIAELQLALLEKHAEMSILSKKNDTLVNDFVRNTKQIQKSGTRVETVRMLAETAAIIDSVKAYDKNLEWSQAIEKAEQYLVDGQVELNNGNIDGASYLANQAIEIIQVCDLDPESTKKQKTKTEFEFSPPLQMEVLKNANVRTEPSLESGVLYLAAAGTFVRAVGYSSEWVKISMKDGRHGWIYYSLLRGTF